MAFKSLVVAALLATAMAKGTKKKASVPKKKSSVRKLNLNPEDTCPFVKCDFSALTAAVLVEEAAQSSALLSTCGIRSIFAKKGLEERDINVFDSSDIISGEGITNQEADADLGSPNRNCNPSGPGIGGGGNPDSPYANCDPQGNLLIIQNTEKPAAVPNDDAMGGCMTINYASPISLLNMGLLDADELITVEVYNSAGANTGMYSSPNTGNNGLWIVNATDPGIASQVDVAKLKICFAGSGGLSFIDFLDCDGACNDDKVDYGVNVGGPGRLGPCVSSARALTRRVSLGDITIDYSSVSEEFEEFALDRFFEFAREDNTGDGIKYTFTDNAFKNSCFEYDVIVGFSEFNPDYCTGGRTLQVFVEAGNNFESPEFDVGSITGACNAAYVTKVAIAPTRPKVEVIVKGDPAAMLSLIRIRPSARRRLNAKCQEERYAGLLAEA